MAMNLFGHGIALSGDFIIQGAPKLTADAAGIGVGEVISASIPLVFVMGLVTTVVAFYFLKKDLKSGKLKVENDNYKEITLEEEWFCSEGNNTVSRKYIKKKDGTERFKYYFEKEVCRNCNKRSECISGTSIGRILEVGLNTSEFYSYSQEQKSEEFKEKYKSRACHEGKNGEMKIHHGLDRARGYGKRSMSTQAKLTALAVNLKRIANILSSKSAISLRIIRFYFRNYRNIVFIR